MLDTAPATKTPVMRSLYLKVTLVTALTVATVICVSVFHSYQHINMSKLAALRETAGVMTNLAGHTLAASDQTDLADKAKAMQDRMFDTAGPDLAEVAFLRLDGSVLSRLARPGEPGESPDLMSLGLQLASAANGWIAQDRRPSPEEELLLSDNGLIAVHPVYSAQSGDVAGIIATRWSDSRLRADTALILRNLILLAALAVTAALALAAFTFHRLIARPLTRVNMAMTQVADGQYALALPERDRRDEVGLAARTLDDLCVKLAGLTEASRIALLKGTGFERASAALMITDPDFRILYANVAAQGLAADHFSAKIAANQPLAGRLVTDIEPALVDLPSHARMTLPRRIDLSVGSERLELMLASVCDASGTLVGYLLDWQIRTETLRNAAILSVIDAGQWRCELSMRGQVLSANEIFAQMFGLTPQSVVGRDCQDVFAFVDPKGPDLWTVLRSGSVAQGLVRASLPMGRTVTLDARFSPIADARGVVQSCLLIATDITDMQADREDGERHRLETEAAQTLVVSALRQALSQLSGGDLRSSLTQSFDPKYEGLRSDYNAATDRLRAAMAEIVESSVAIRGEVSDISAAAENLSRRTEQQAATLEQTSAALDQMTASVKTTAGVASHANAKVEEAKQSAETSGRVVREAVSAMGEIEQSSSKISRITSVIDEIAFQTNLLALNAGVEAARAGEAGRGFAVVASEVRDLAQRSSEAAREIAGLITDSSDQVKRGVSLVAEAGRSLTGIQSAVSEVHGLVAEIASSAKEQSNGIAELNTAVKHLDEVTQQNAAMFEETTAASQSLNRAATDLANTTQRFILNSGPSEDRGAGGLSGKTAQSWGAPKAASSASRPAPVALPAKAAPGTFQSSRRLTGAQATAVKPTEAEGWEDF